MKHSDYYVKISAIAVELSKYDGDDLESQPLDKIIPLLDAIEVIAQDMEVNFVSARRILNEERISGALMVIRAF
jgi:hypothetical protein